MEINYIDDNIMQNIINSKFDAVIVPMGINNSFNRSLRHEISINFPEVKEVDAKTGYGDKRKYGKILLVNTDFCTIILCYIDNGGYKANDPIEYDFFRKCIDAINDKFDGKNIATTKFWTDDEKMDEILKNVKFNLYIYNENDFKTEIFHKIAELHQLSKDKKIDQNEYSKRRSKIEWIRKNGLIKEMPEDYIYIPKMKQNKG